MIDPLEIRHLVASAAREELVERFSAGSARLKRDGSVVTEADHRLQAAIREGLERVCPGYGFLGEEMSVAEQEAVLARPGAGFWCLDPLDGTSNFASGIPFFSLSLALVGPAGPEFGLVYDPVRDECFWAGRGRGAWLDGTELGAAAAGPLDQAIACVDFKRLSRGLATELVQGFPCRSQRNFGSCALEWCWLAAARIQVYLHGGQKLWDYAAGSLILAEAGGIARTLDGQDVYKPTLAPRSVIAAGNDATYAIWRDWISAHAR